tara:strand:+ start:65 stop:307 length:243 start_codon:yes stop_codon:yes gene_type:complete
MYSPQVDDYVKWTTTLGNVHEGWVYFADREYITIELSVKDKSEQSYKDSPIHRKIHSLLLCQHYYWDQLEYVKHRRKEDA